MRAGPQRRWTEGLLAAAACLVLASAEGITGLQKDTTSYDNATSCGKSKACEAEATNQQKVAYLREGVFTDFAGREFSFPGEESQVYNLITEADHQLNAVLVPEQTWLSKEFGATFRGVGIHGPDTVILVRMTPERHLEVTVNERPFLGRQLRLDGVTVTSGCYDSACPTPASTDSMSVRDSFMTLWFWVAPESGHLNFKAMLTGRPMSQVHGVLGQSVDSEGNFVSAAPSTRVALPANKQFYGEGQVSDYSTTDLFSSDSTFSMFARKAERRRHKRKRQMLEGNALASMAFAAKAAQARAKVS